MNGTVLECAAAGSPLSQLRTGTFIAGSEAAGETLARAIALEVATAPFGSSSGGFTFTFNPATRAFSRRAGTFGPAFSERALTIGKGKLSGGFNFLHRSYDRIDGLALGGFEVFRFQGGTLPVTSSRFELETSTNTLAGFADYGVLDNFDIGVLVPYVRISRQGGLPHLRPVERRAAARARRCVGGRTGGHRHLRQVSILDPEPGHCGQRRAARRPGRGA